MNTKDLTYEFIYLVLLTDIICDTALLLNLKGLMEQIFSIGIYFVQLFQKEGEADQDHQDNTDPDLQSEKKEKDITTEMQKDRGYIIN